MAGRRRPGKKAIALGEGLFFPESGVVSASTLERHYPEQRAGGALSCFVRSPSPLRGVGSPSRRPIGQQNPYAVLSVPLW